MKPNITLHPSNIPVSPTLTTFAVQYLLLAHFNAPEWAYWIWGGFVFLVLWGWWLVIRNRIFVDIFEESKSKLGIK